MRKAIVAAGLLSVAVPAPAAAHGGAGGSSSGWSLLSIPALIVLVVGVTLVGRSKGASRVGGASLIAIGILGAVGGLVLPALTRSPTVHGHVLIVEPDNGSQVQAERPLEVEARVDAPLASSASDRTGGHLHLYVDDKLQQMPYSTRAEVVLKPGRHRIRVEYVDNRHASFNPPVEDSVVVEALARAP